MKIDWKRLKQFVPEAMGEPPSGDDWLEAHYQADVPICGHTNPYYKLFWLIAREFKPAFSVELGTYRGNTAAHLAVGNPEGQAYTIDWHRDPGDIVHKVWAIQVGERYPNVKFISAASWSSEAVGQVAEMALKHPIDILFIDAWHWYEHAIREWDIYKHFLADEALVVCDDIQDNPGSTVDMVKFWTEVRADYEYFTDYSKLHFGVMMGFIRYLRK